jgi:hypothetical protein
MDNCNKFEIEKVSDLKKEIKTFIKGIVRSKLFTDNEDTIQVEINKSIDAIEGDKDVERYIDVTVNRADNGVVASLSAIVSTRVYNKFDVTIFDQISAQLAKAKKPITLKINY